MIGVLSPFIGGAYYGGLLAGVAQAAARVGDRVVAIQTLDAGSYMADGHVPAEFMPPIAWDHVRGFIVVVDAVNVTQLRQIRAAGKPLVVIGHRYPGFSCPTVFAENGAGVRDAVGHLIAHGHRRIAFAGYPAATDIMERYQAYLDTLREHGIEPDPDLVYRVEDTREPGGVDAARRMLAAGVPSTAVLAGTDLGAIGIMRTLTAHGLVLPADQAVVGFDDVDSAAYLSPSLASVKQLVGAMGDVAVDLLHRQLRGEPVRDDVVRVVTNFVPRASCGCSGLEDLSGGRDAVPAEDPRTALSTRLSALLPPVGARRPTDLPDLTEGVLAIADAVDGVVGGGTPVELPEHALRRLYAIRPHPESLTAITNAVQAYADAIVPPDGCDGPTVHRVAAQVRQVTLQLAQIQGRWSFRDNADFRAAVSSQYEVSMELLHSHEHDPRSLHWLARTTASGGALGLWTADSQDGAQSGAKLEVVGVYLRGHPEPAVGDPTTIESFPPAELFALPEAPEDVVFVVPVKGNANDWGLLAVVGPLETRVPNGRETVNQCAALLTVALDLRSQEERLRRAAQYDTLTGLPNRALLLERLDRAVRRARRHGYRFALLFLDLDGFKKVNDSLGHAAGDQLLVEVAGRIIGTLREIDTAARFGGDEFVVLLEDIGDEQYAALVAERLRSVLAEPLRLEGTDISVRASTGIAIGTDAHENAEDVLREADAAMYRSKLRSRTERPFDPTGP
jgi:diguanylate cyclase (GGDEF)-like protein